MKNLIDFSDICDQSQLGKLIRTRDLIPLDFLPGYLVNRNIRFAEEMRKTLPEHISAKSTEGLSRGWSRSKRLACMLPLKLKTEILSRRPEQ